MARVALARHQCITCSYATVYLQMHLYSYLDTPHENIPSKQPAVVSKLKPRLQHEITPVRHVQVQLYLNATGLMWENAEDFGAMLIFAEHRYYGESLPFGDKTFEHMEWLTSEQALADYATLLRGFKKEKGLEKAPVIGFGGSYGGMLATWGRLKYPHVRFHALLHSGGN